MACTGISTSGSITLTPGTLSTNFCHESWQSTMNAFVNATTATMGTGALFAANDTAPATDYVWLKQSTQGGSPSCDVLGWYFYSAVTTDWEPIPVPDDALPIVSGLPTVAKGSSTKNAVVKVDTHGRVTELTEVEPADESTDGHAKAWVKFASPGGTFAYDGTAYNCSVTRTSTGVYVITTSGVTFNNVCLAIGSGPGFGDYAGTGASDSSSFTGADHVRIYTTIVSGNGIITVNLPRQQHKGEDAADGDENWENELAEANGISIVIFGN